MRAALLLIPVLFAFKAEGPVDIASPDAAPTLLNYMEDRLAGSPYVDMVPGGLPRTIVQDEAKIVSLHRNKACFDVTTRTQQFVENLRGDYLFKVNGDKVWPEGEPTIEVADYDYTGSRTVLDASAITSLFEGHLRVTEPTQNTTRVVQRTWRVCGSPGVKKRRVDLHVLHQSRDLTEGALIERYRWHLR